MRAALALLLALTSTACAVHRYQSELPPLRPRIFLPTPMGTFLLDAPALDLPAAPPGRPLKLLRLGPSNVFTSQAAFTTFCKNLDVKDNIVYTNAFATVATKPTLVITTGCVWLSGYVSPNAMSTELQQMRSNTLPGVNVTALRDQYHGDQVTLYNNEASGNCGIAYVGAANYGSGWAFSVVRKDCADSNFSDVHERGHNMGLEHDDPNAAGATSPAGVDAFGFCDNVGALVPHNRRDPMVYPSPCGGSRVAYFGNPDDTHFGYPFGDATHNAARVVRWALPIMANFYAPLNPQPAAPGKPTVH